MLKPGILTLAGFSLFPPYSLFLPKHWLPLSLQTDSLHKVKNSLRVAPEWGLLQLQPLETDPVLSPSV